MKNLLDKSLTIIAVLLTIYTIIIALASIYFLFTIYGK